MKKILIVVLLINIYISAQSINVVETKQIKIDNSQKVYYPKFSKDDNNILFTSENYKGLYTYNLDRKVIKTVSEEDGAGYSTHIVDKDLVVFRTHEITNGRKYHSVKSYDMVSEIITTIEENKRRIRIPNQLSNSKLTLVEESSVKQKTVKTFLEKTNSVTKSVYVENDNLIYVEDGNAKIINPLGKGTYVWESLSKDGKYLLFTFSNKGSFLCDLDGTIIKNLKSAHYPKLSPNGKFISYMNDKDDGQNYISSDIYVYSIDLDKSFQITKTDDKIEMYPEWSNNGLNLVYHSLKGELFITNIEIEN